MIQTLSPGVICIPAGDTEEAASTMAENARKTGGLFPFQRVRVAFYVLV